MRAVLDANVVVRAVLGKASGPAEWVARLEDVHFAALVPDLLFPEVAQALLGYFKHGDVTMTTLERKLAYVCDLPFRVHATQELVTTAVPVAASRQLSVSDACYAVLAEAEGAILVTGDRRLAAAVTQAELV